LPNTSLTGEPHLDVRLSGWSKKAGEPDPAAFHEHELEAQRGRSSLGDRLRGLFGPAKRS
jgi:hypothetical protein